MQQLVTLTSAQCLMHQNYTDVSYCPVSIFMHILKAKFLSAGTAYYFLANHPTEQLPAVLIISMQLMSQTMSGFMRLIQGLTTDFPFECKSSPNLFLFFFVLDKVGKDQNFYSIYITIQRTNQRDFSYYIDSGFNRQKVRETAVLKLAVLKLKKVGLDIDFKVTMSTMYNMQINAPKKAGI